MVNNMKVESESRDKEYFKDKEVSFSVNNNPESMDAVTKKKIVISALKHRMQKCWFS